MFDIVKAKDEDGNEVEVTTEYVDSGVRWVCFILLFMSLRVMMFVIPSVATRSHLNALYGQETPKPRIW